MRDQLLHSIQCCADAGNQASIAIHNLCIMVLTVTLICSITCNTLCLQRDPDAGKKSVRHESLFPIQDAYVTD